MKQKNASNTNRSRTWEFLPFLVFEVILVVVLLGLVMYLIAQYKSQQFQPFELATAVGLLGGFSFGLAVVPDCPKQLSLRLRLIGVLYLAATIGFIIFGFYQAADQAQLVNNTSPILVRWWFTATFQVSFYSGALALVIALFYTVWSIPNLINWKDDPKGLLKSAFSLKNEKQEEGNAGCQD